MQSLPHHYNVIVTATGGVHTEIASEGLVPLASASPKEFDGPGDSWSPETLMVAAVADCLALTFRSIANASRLRWAKLVCGAEGTVDHVDGVTRFTAIELHAQLVIPAETEPDKARRLLEKAEKACLVGNSLKFNPVLRVDIAVQ